MLSITELRFLIQSNMIEGIDRALTAQEQEGFKKFMQHDRLSLEKVVALVEAFQPDAKLRCGTGMDVRVGNYYPPRGGPVIGYKLCDLIERINNKVIDPFDAHLEYETLHPFTDGNGRSGRMIWWWSMKGTSLPVSFLHAFYYSALSKMSKR